MPTDEDIYDPNGWRWNALLQPESHEAFQALLPQRWTDSLLGLHGSGSGIYTFMDYFQQRTERARGLRIDRMLANPVLVKGLKSADVDR